MQQVSKDKNLRIVLVDHKSWGADLHVVEKTNFDEAAKLIQNHRNFSTDCSHVYFLKPHQRWNKTPNRLKQLPHLIFNEQAYGDMPRRQDQVISGDYTELSETLAYQHFLALTQEMLPDKRFYKKRGKTYRLQG